MTAVARLEDLLSRIQKNRAERAYLMLPFERMGATPMRDTRAGAAQQEAPHAWVDHGPRHEVGGAAMPSPSAGAPSAHDGEAAARDGQRRHPEEPQLEERESRVATKPQLPTIPEEPAPTPVSRLTIPEPSPQASPPGPDTAPEIVFDSREVELTEEELLAAEAAESAAHAEVVIADEPSEPLTQDPVTRGGAPETLRGHDDSALRPTPMGSAGTPRTPVQLPTGKGQLLGDVAPHSEEVVTQPKPTLEPITEPKPAVAEARSERADTIEPVTQPRPEHERISTPPPLPLSELSKRARPEAGDDAAEAIADPSTEVSGMHEAPVSPTPADVDAITSKMRAAERVDRTSPPPLPVVEAPRGASKTQVSFDAPPSPTPAPVIQEQAAAGRRVISPKVLQPPALAADAVGEFIGEIEAVVPSTFGAIVDASLALVL